ncbi:hypothetical protein DVH24_005503 [Malus domestica]|uniref:Uncharacterized protein n=1 Tax=Malus domestica TaxID=3750 RepID=A0A498KN36_MALDO|nr:hypothetical protein DVH24_005503 [Malus domestica]
MQGEAEALTDMCWLCEQHRCVVQRSLNWKQKSAFVHKRLLSLSPLLLCFNGPNLLTYPLKGYMKDSILCACPVYLEQSEVEISSSLTASHSWARVLKLHNAQTSCNDPSIKGHLLKRIQCHLLTLNETSNQRGIDINKGAKSPLSTAESAATATLFWRFEHLNLVLLLRLRGVFQ